MRIIVLLIAIIVANASSKASVLDIRGGGVGPRQSYDGTDYYDQFELDYGTKDNERIAGALRGFVKSGALSRLREDDAFLVYMNKYLEDGPEAISGRVKPFYAADFGRKADLNKGENPKIIIVNRKLRASADGSLMLPAPGPVEVEVRDVWQPWLKARCNFAVRYIVPNRRNVLRIMDAQGKFTTKIIREDSTEGGKPRVAQELTFRPRILSRLMGEKPTVMRRTLPTSVLYDVRSKRKTTLPARTMQKAAKGAHGPKTTSAVKTHEQDMAAPKKKKKKREIEKEKSIEGGSKGVTVKIKTPGAGIQRAGKGAEVFEGKDVALRGRQRSWRKQDELKAEAGNRKASVLGKLNGVMRKTKA